MKKRTVFLLVVAAEAGIIAFLYGNYRRALESRVSVDPIKKETISRNKLSSLRYYYEPVAGLTETDFSPWLIKPVQYTINKDTLNETKNYPAEKPAGTFRIVVLGDSFVFGQNVNTKDNWTELLENKLGTFAKECGKNRQVEVINLGVQGYDLQYAAERYRLRGKKYSPDLVLWLIKDDDLDVVNELLTPMREMFLRNLKKDDKYKPGYENTNKGYMDMRKLFDAKYPAAEIDKLQAGYLNAYAKTAGAPTFFINYETFRNKDNVISRMVSESRDMFLQEKIINVVPKEDQYVPDDFHFNENGNKKIAGAVYDLLLKRGFIKCTGAK